MLWEIFVLILGLFFLYLGSEWLVRGSVSLALAFYIRPIIVGLTVVALATSAPELLVSLLAAAKGSSGISVGNVLGSNVINIALVLGISATVRPMIVNRRVVGRELLYMIVVSTLFWILCFDGSLSRMDGLILLTGLAIFLVNGFLTAREAGHWDMAVKKSSPKRMLWHLFLVFVGLATLALSANLVVKSAISLAESMGFSEAFIGLSIVALGTSLPELATSVVAIAKGQSDISLGNVVGSNLFNICLVMGAVGIIHPLQIDPGLNRFEFPEMVFLSMLLYIFAKGDFKISRSEGLLFIACFFVFLGVSYWMAQSI
jgi:cation:H+ antiporter